VSPARHAPRIAQPTDEASLDFSSPRCYFRHRIWAKAMIKLAFELAFGAAASAGAAESYCHIA
jgi:hypothetical protein